MYDCLCASDVSALVVVQEVLIHILVCILGCVCVPLMLNCGFLGRHVVLNIRRHVECEVFQSIVLTLSFIFLKTVCRV